MSLADLVVDAYRVKKFQIFGLPGWGDSGSDLYDVDATIPENVKPTPDEARWMLRTLLAGRFQLRVHHESRLLPVYALVVSKKGFKLIATQEPCVGRLHADVSRSSQRRNPDTTAENPSESPLPWAFYAQELSIFTDRPVVDESGITGAGYCTADGLPPTFPIFQEVSRGGGAGASVFTAVEDQWGMKLEPKNVQLDVIVVDHVERPSEN